MEHDVEFISEISAVQWLERTAAEHGLNAEEVLDVYYDIRPYAPTRAEVTRAVKEALEEYEIYVP